MKTARWSPETNVCLKFFFTVAFVYLLGSHIVYAIGTVAVWLSEVNWSIIDAVIVVVLVAATLIWNHLYRKSNQGGDAI